MSYGNVHLSIRFYFCETLLHLMLITLDFDRNHVLISVCTFQCKKCCFRLLTIKIVQRIDDIYLQ